MLTHTPRGLAVLLLSLFMLNSAQAENHTLRLHHFLGPNSPAQAVLLEPFAQRLRDESNGQLDVSIHPGMSLGGVPGDLYQQLVDGEVDMIWTLAGYHPGQFPRTEVFELPSVHFRSAYATNRAIYANFDLIEADYADVKPLLVHVHGGNALHLKNHSIQSAADVRNLRIHTPSRTGSWLMEAWGSRETTVPVLQIRDAFANDQIDGALLPLEIFTALGLESQVTETVQGSDGSRFGTAVFLLLMNKDRYESLPANLRQVIDDQIGQDLYRSMGQAWDDLEAPMFRAQRDRVNRLDVDIIYDFEALSEQVVRRWIDDMARQGIDGETLVHEARRYIARYSRIITTLE
ncbi:TRAP transporter substrate-binding protein [Saccharospirillum alexandrii]|uniref:TRAP transporter substrate-binding protein n=1 Tax=Saccharospirillum alexandrii TaxID=2448477 RepID=UPI000FD7B4D5|nr:TRAP transporter substrate-binding protein [Saccharospirillum alexandrii]